MAGIPVRWIAVHLNRRLIKALSEAVPEELRRGTRAVAEIKACHLREAAVAELEVVELEVEVVAVEAAAADNLP